MLKKIIKNIRKKDIDIYLMLILLIGIFNHKQIIWVGDGLWDFSNIYKMSIGYRIYKDLNVIITPFFFDIGKILFNILGRNFRTYVLYNFVIYMAFFTCINVIFKELNINKNKRVAFFLILFIFFKQIIPVGANYNIIAFITVFISIILFLKKKENYYIHGILVFITIMCKQNMGAFHGIGVLLFIITQNDKDIKNKIISIIQLAITNFVLLAVFLIYYKCNGLLADFMDMAVLGIREFSTKNIAFNYNASLYFYLAILIDIFLIYVVNSKKLNFSTENETIKNNIKMLVCIGTPMILVGIPIVNAFHSVLSCTIISFAFFYTIENMIFNEIKTKKEYLIKILIIMFLILSTVYYIIETKDFTYCSDRNSPYYGGYISKEANEQIENICKFIVDNNSKNIRVIILSQEANAYMTPLKKANREFDLPFMGNLGKDGEDGLIKKIKNLRNTKILIKKDEEKVFWQESIKVRKYIEENLENIGEIEGYSIFYTK